LIRYGGAPAIGSYDIDERIGVNDSASPQ